VIEEPLDMHDHIFASWNKVTGLSVEKMMAWLEILRVMARKADKLVGY
jgi:hypothetical protein